MRFTYLGLSTLALTTLLGACSGYNSQSFGMQNQTHHSASRYGQNAYVRPVQAQYGHSGYNAYGNTQYSGYGHNQHGTVLRGGAPYGAALHNSPYTRLHKPLHNPYGTFNQHVGGYGNIGLVKYNDSDDRFGIQGRIGHNFNPFFAVEAEASTGTADETFEGRTVGIDYTAAGFGLVKVPLGRKLSAHARLGYHKTQITYETPVRDEILDSDGIAYGAGLEFAFDRNNAIRADYTRYKQDFLRGDDFDSASLSYVYKF
ncbi:MAG: hypothetical protein COA43_10525 [Robiginitomaculum sp.]|nr:MAG: hypothetical protein COA43_10525 [Robiginitomaculum sp.]